MAAVTGPAALLSRLLAAGQQIPAGQKRLHPADPLDVQPEILDQMLDVPDAADVLVRKEAVPRAGTVGNDEPLPLVLRHGRHGEAHLPGQDADGHHGVICLLLVPWVRHEPLHPFPPEP